MKQKNKRDSFEILIENASKNYLKVNKKKNKIKKNNHKKNNHKKNSS